MDIKPRMIRARVRNDGTRHTCWACGKPVNFNVRCWTWTTVTRDLTAQRYAHEGCRAGEVAA